MKHGDRERGKQYTKERREEDERKGKGKERVSRKVGKGSEEDASWEERNENTTEFT